MQYIDKAKSPNKEQGHKILDDFVSPIEKQFADQGGKYVNIGYNSFPHEEMLRLLISEQNGYCCYCMREINIKKDATIEHVIPHKANSSIFNEYINNNDCFIKEYLCYWGEPPYTQKVNTPPYPHFIAYENLVASCNGHIITSHQCCNGKRDNLKIIPIFFLSEISRLIQYENDGSITYFDENLKTTIENTGLNQETLKLFRRAWCKICRQYSVDQVKMAIEDIDLRYDILIDCFEGNDYQRETLFNNNYWILFAKYGWFYTYYLGKYI